MGNHDIFLRNFFEVDFSRTGFDIERNGHGFTLSQLLDKKITVDSDFEYESKEMNKKYPQIRKLLSTNRYYLELGDFIFVHGGIDGSLDNWREDTIKNFIWNKQHKLDGIKGKTIVCGHVQNVTIREPENYKKYLREPLLHKEKFNILYRNGVIHIDGSVCDTKKINVLILEII
jgi:serine/threonine protein phosphatase 1